MNKYTIRKLMFILILAALVAAPFAVVEYKSLTTSDPFILMAREIEAFSVGEVDVINVKPADADSTHLMVLLFIEPYPDWSEVKRENLKRYVLQVARDNEYEGLEIAMGWNYSAKTIRIQLFITCPELKTASCVYLPATPGIVVLENYITWPGIGKP